MKPSLITMIASTALLVAWPLAPTSTSALGQISQPTKIVEGGVELHYIERGQGEPLILLHGGQGDYRSWQRQLEVLASRHRVISYSRRYHYPNANAITSTSHSALVDAEDLAEFVDSLQLGRVHLIGTSYGAFTALVFAIKNPRMVRSMVLAEPPVHQWATNSARGRALYKDFLTNVHQPAGQAFAAGRDEDAMRIFIDAFDGRGTFDGLPDERRADVMANARFFKALTSSSDPFPLVSRDDVRRLRLPVLIVRGENTDELHRLVADELAGLLPTAPRVLIPKAGHGSPRQNPGAFNAAVLEFLGTIAQ